MADLMVIKAVWWYVAKDISSEMELNEQEKGTNPPTAAVVACDREKTDWTSKGKAVNERDLSLR